MKNYILSQQNRDFMINYLDSSNLPHSDIKVLLMTLTNLKELEESVETEQKPKEEIKKSIKK